MSIFNDRLKQKERFIGVRIDDKEDVYPALKQFFGARGGGLVFHRNEFACLASPYRSVFQQKSFQSSVTQASKLLRWEGVNNFV
ncbi:MAG: hypothetical protein ACRD9R_01975 [Pyrinomonadaceae bacterium]